MAESFTTRLHLPRWTAPTDTPNRAEFDGAMADLEARVTRFLDGTIGARPAAAAQYEGTLYVVNDAAGGGTLGAAYYCDGAGWLYMNPPSTLDFGEVGDIATVGMGIPAAAGATGEVADAGHVHAFSADFGEAADIAAVAPGPVAAAGATGEVADAGHVHAMRTPYAELFLHGGR